MNAQREILDYAKLFNEALINVFQDNKFEDEKSYEITTGMTIAFFDIVRQICTDGEGKDLIDSMQVAERLLLDYIIKYDNPLKQKDTMGNIKEDNDRCFECKYAAENMCLQHEFNSDECKFFQDRLESMRKEVQESLP